MIKLSGTKVYLATLEREHCRALWEAGEYDENNPTEPLNIGLSVQKADEWFEEIQRLQGKQNVRLGVFLPDGEVIGDVALQDIDWRNRSCSIGMGFPRVAQRSKGYGTQAVELILRYAFFELGLNRVVAQTLDINAGAQRSLEKVGFKLEGREREAVFCGGRFCDRLVYGLLGREFMEKYERLTVHKVLQGIEDSKDGRFTPLSEVKREFDAKFRV